MFRETGLWVAILFLTMTTSPTFGQSGSATRATIKPAPAPFLIEAESYEESQRVTKVVFKNGLTALVYESHVQPLVSASVYVSGGFLDDPVELTGISELTAQTRKNIGEGSPAGSIHQRAQALGGVFQSRVGPRHSCFEITVPSSRWRQAMGIHADAILLPYENSESLRLEAARILEDIREGLVSSGIVAREELRTLVFGRRNFEMSDYLSKAEPESIIGFHKNRYVLPAITLIIAGDITPGDVLNEAVRVFGARIGNTKEQITKPLGTKTPNLQVLGNMDSASTLSVTSEGFEISSDVETATPLVRSGGTDLEAASGFRYRAISGGTGIPKVFFGFPCPPKNTEDYRALEVAAAILGTGETSILNIRLRDRKNLVLSAQTGIESFGDAGLFFVELETELRNIDKTEIAFWTELEILKRNGPSEVELERATAQLESLWWGKRETVGELANALAVSEFHGRWKQMDGYIAEIRKITIADVKRVLAQHLTLSDSTLLEYLPDSAPERKHTASSVRTMLEGLLRPTVDEELNARIGETAANLKIPAAGTTFRLNEVRHPFRVASILRGPEMYIREDHSSPLVEMGVYFSGGKALEDEKNAGITGLMLELMLRNEFENRRLEIYGGRLTPVTTNDYFGFYLSIPSRHFSVGFERVKQAIKSPGFEEVEIEKLKQLADTRVRGAETARSTAQCRLNEGHFRRCSYVVESRLTSESMKNISVKTVQGWYEENVRNVKPLVLIVGSTEGTSLAEWFVSEFSGSRMREGKSVVSTPEHAKKLVALDQNRCDERVSSIILSFQVPSVGDMDVYGMLVLNEYLKNRLMDIERTGENNLKRKLLYGRIECGYLPLQTGGSFVIAVGVKAGEEATGLEDLRAGVANVSTQSLQRVDFNAARALAGGSYVAGNQTRKAQIGNLAKNLLAGMSLEDYQDFLLNVENVSEEDFRELMRRVLGMNKVVTVVMCGGN